MKKKRFHPLTKLVVVLFFLSFDGLAWKWHGFLYPWFTLLPMSSCKEFFSGILLTLVRCFFFSNSGGSFFSVSFPGSASSSVSASEVDMLFGSTTCSSSSSVG